MPVQDVLLTVDDKLTIAGRLDEFGFDYIEGGWPGSNERDAAFFIEEELEAAPREDRRLRLDPARQSKSVQDRNWRLILRADTPVATVVGKTWDLHVREALRITNGTDRGHPRYHRIFKKARTR